MSASVCIPLYSGSDTAVVKGDDGYIKRKTDCGALWYSNHMGRKAVAPKKSLPSSPARAAQMLARIDALMARQGIESDAELGALAEHRDILKNWRRAVANGVGYGPSIWTLLDLARALKTTVAYLVGETEVTATENSDLVEDALALTELLVGEEGLTKADAPKLMPVLLSIVKRQINAPSAESVRGHKRELARFAIEQFLQKTPRKEDQ